MRAARESFQRVGETCPAVDSAASDFGNAIESDLRFHLESFVASVKVQTTSLRDAFIEALDERNDAREERDAARAEVESLETQLAERDAEIQELRAQIEALEAA